jgi:hypothetical protein
LISFEPLPESVVPSIVQVPYKFPFYRLTVYAILSADAVPTSSVCLRGTTASGDELELEIAVQVVQKKGQTIHRLTTRKILQELEEGTGYIHGRKYGVDDRDSGTFDDGLRGKALVWDWRASGLAFW